MDNIMKCSNIDVLGNKLVKAYLTLGYDLHWSFEDGEIVIEDYQYLINSLNLINKLSNELLTDLKKDYDKYKEEYQSIIKESKTEKL